MSNTKIVIAVIVVVVLVLGGYFAFTHKAVAPVPETMTASTTPEVTASTTENSDATAMPVDATAAAHTTLITYTNAGFSPKTVSIKVGDTVRFVNNSSHGMWVASNAHPTHTAYDGTSAQQHCSNGTDTNGGFDECTAVNPGSVYSFTFPKAGAFEFHNHVQASDTGTVTVK